MLSQESETNPQISVVVRAFNEEGHIVKTLESLERQTLGPSHFEVVVVNNGSTDRTAEKVEAFCRQNTGFPIRLVDEPKRGRGPALHRGVEEAGNDWVATLDADSVADPSWLKIISHFIENNPQFIAGSGRVRFRNGPTHHRFAYDLGRNAVFATASRLNAGWLSGANSWFLREAFFDCGGTGDLPESATLDDRILALRLRKIGRIGHHRDAVVETDNWLSKKRFWLSQDVPRELNEVRRVTGARQSLTHRIVNGLVVPPLRVWDRLAANY